MRKLTPEIDGPRIIRLADMLEGLESAAGRRTKIRFVGTLFEVAFEHVQRHPITGDAEFGQLLADVSAYEATRRVPSYVEVAERSLCG